MKLGQNKFKRRIIGEWEGEGEKTEQNTNGLTPKRLIVNNLGIFLKKVSPKISDVFGPQSLKFLSPVVLKERRGSIGFQSISFEIFSLSLPTNALGESKIRDLYLYITRRDNKRKGHWEKVPVGITELFRKQHIVIYVEE